MSTISYKWNSSEGEQTIEMVRVAGTNGRPYLFGDGKETRLIEVREFWITTIPITQGFWAHVEGVHDSPAIGRGQQRPVENVSWEVIMAAGGFLQQINASAIREQMCAQASLASARFRLPSETEWEYAARGGPECRDGFRYSGSNDIDRVAWHDRKGGDHTHEVAQKSPNQLGIYDMSGNVWEWCQDSFTQEVPRIPADGTAFLDQGGERVLRGGCFHNWAMHCTVSKRYQIESDYHDGCIGFRLVLAPG